MIKDKVVAMLLAGGQGSRLKSLTEDVAKPAVQFGGKYRIIDFALSNATNSGIKDIGILTQYKPYELNSHIGIGSSWDFDRNEGGLRILPPFMSQDGGRWFTGTANAIYENIDFIDNVNPEYVLILSGDHIYKMNYNDLLDAHREKNADVTIASMEVPWEEASRFGILNTNEDLDIYEFDEKPEKPKNNMASMGIYMFSWKVLREYLISDNNDKDSSHDFGKNILPTMLNDGKRMFAWLFDGYWKDVGTVQSYWEANMDLLDINNDLGLHDRDWRIYTRNLNLPPQFVDEGAIVDNSLLNEGCVIKGEVVNSILSCGVIVEKGAKVSNSVILPNAVIKANAKVNNAVVMEDVVLAEGREIGLGNDGIYLVDSEKVMVE